MAVANDTIIQKMIKELQNAKEQQDNHTKMVKHIGNVRLLCDLFLEEDSSVSAVSNTTNITPEEMKAMIGKSEHKTKQGPFKKSTIDHDDANGNSIFDF